MMTVYCMDILERMTTDNMAKVYAIVDVDTHSCKV